MRLAKCLLPLTILLVIGGCATPTDNTSSPRDAADTRVDREALATDKSPSQIASEAQEATVSITGYWGGEAVQAGTGFFVREDGVLVTNMHVIAGADAVSVELNDGEIYQNVYVLAMDERRDLILLQLPASKVPVIPIADDREIQVGDPIYVIGDPLGLRGTFSDGLLSGRRVEDGVTYIQITAPISTGSSGGPVLNARGEAIGIATSIYASGQNLNIAVPARHAAGLLQMPHNPMSFASIASALREQREVAIGERQSQVTEILEALPEEARASFQELIPHERQVGLRLLQLQAAANHNGLELTDHFASGLIAEDEVDGMAVPLTPGEYVAVGACDNDCTDLDLIILKENGEPLAQDIETDAEAVVRFSVTSRGEYTIAASMAECSTDVCFFAIQLYK